MAPTCPAPSPDASTYPVHAAITAALGFLVAVLWFDLMSVVSLIGSGLAIMLALTRVVPTDRYGPTDCHAPDEGELNRALVTDLATALDAEAPSMIRSMSTADHREAAAAFVEKRSPTFTGE